MPLGESLDQLGLRCRAQQSGQLPPHGVTEVSVAPRPRRFIGLSRHPSDGRAAGVLAPPAAVGSERPPKATGV